MGVGREEKRVEDEAHTPLQVEGMNRTRAGEEDKQQRGAPCLGAKLETAGWGTQGGGRFHIITRGHGIGWDKDGELTLVSGNWRVLVNLTRVGHVGWRKEPRTSGFRRECAGRSGKMLWGQGDGAEAREGFRV